MRIGETFPSYPRHPRAGGSHQGISPPHVPKEIFTACNDKDGINMVTFLALQTTLDYEDLLDILEMKRVRDSWAHAAMFDSDDLRDSHSHGGQ
jgi:hypothetical protein